MGHFYFGITERPRAIGEGLSEGSSAEVMGEAAPTKFARLLGADDEVRVSVPRISAENMMASCSSDQ